MKIIRQGDILMVAVDTPPPSFVRPVTSVTLAEGETTGHCHTLMGAAVLVWHINDQTYVRVEGSPGSIMHPDHDPVACPALELEQTYQIIRQKEWDLGGQWRQIQD